MKFVIGLIALIFIALAAYVFTGQSSKKVAKSTVTQKMEKTEVAKTKVEKPVKVAKEVGISRKQKIRKNDEMSVKSTSLNEGKSVLPENEIGKGLTLEGIESADVSDEDKEIMIGDMLYQHSLNQINETSLNEEEIQKIIIEDTQNGI